MEIFKNSTVSKESYTDLPTLSWLRLSSPWPHSNQMGKDDGFHCSLLNVKQYKKICVKKNLLLAMNNKWTFLRLVHRVLRLHLL